MYPVNPPRAKSEAVQAALELRRSLDQTMLTTLRVAAPALAAAFVLNAVLHARVLKCAAASEEALSSLTLALIAMVSWTWSRRPSARPERSHGVMGMILCLGLLSGFRHYAGEGADQHPHLVLFLLATAGATLVSRRWLEAVLATAVVGWTAVGYASTNSVDWVEHLGAAAAAVVVISAVFELRRWPYARLSALRSESASQAEQLRISDQRYELAVGAARDGIWDWDIESGRVFYSERWKEIAGCGDEFSGDDLPWWFQRVPEGDVEALQAALFRHVEGLTKCLEVSHRIRRLDGRTVRVLTRGLAVRDDTGKALRVAGSLTDVTHLHEVEEQLRHDAAHDALTGLPNRTRLMAALRERFERSRSAPGAHFAVLFIDLDGFKLINDSLGHLWGDEFLAAVAHRLEACAEEGEIAARYGGDEFVILASEASTREDVERLARRLRSVLAPRFLVGGHEIPATVSVGAALSSLPVDRPEDLLRNADIAMYFAKSRGPGRFEVFDHRMHDATLKEWRLRTDLAGALERNELVLYYQPIVDAASGRIVSAEALLRWNRGDDLIEPAELIRVAEETGMIDRVGAFTLQEATRRCCEWQQISSAPISVAVNLSARQLQDDSIVADVNEALLETGLDPAQLELELTETTMLEPEGVGAANLLSLWRLGVRLAIDDFGTGYSSLGYLRRFRFDTIKICQDFTERLPEDADSAALARNVIRLAHDFELRVTGEGVETQSQLEFLQSHGCDRIQGFLAAPPLPAEDFADLLRSGQAILPSDIARKPLARASASVAKPSLLPHIRS